MFEKFKEHVRELKAGDPGRRFQELHRRRTGRGKRRKPLVVAAAFVLILVGVVLLVVPGPGLPLLFVGVALIAQELLIVARALDWLELHLRKWMGKG